MESVCPRQAITWRGLDRLDDCRGEDRVDDRRAQGAEDRQDDADSGRQCLAGRRAHTQADHTARQRDAATQVAGRRVVDERVEGLEGGAGGTGVGNRDQREHQGHSEDGVLDAVVGDGLVGREGLNEFHGDYS